MKKIIQDKTKKLLKAFNKFKDEMQKSGKRETFVMPDTDFNKIKKDKRQVVDISSSSVARATLTIILILVLGYFLYELRSLLLIFFIALFLSAALDPIIDFLETKKIPRSLSVIVVFILILLIITAVFASAIPIIIKQLSSLLSWLSESVFSFFKNIQDNSLFSYIPEKSQDFVLQTLKTINLETILQELVKNLSTILNQLKDLASGSFKHLGDAASAVGGVTASFASFLFDLFLVLFLTFFMVVDRSNLHNFFLSLFPQKHGMYISQKIKDIQSQIGAWFRGQLILSFLMFIVTFLGLLLIGMGEYALTLAFIMAIGEFIPYVGPIIFFIFGFPISLGLGLTIMISFVIFHMILQFLEGNFFVPMVMNKAVGLSPIVVLLVLIIGFQFLGIIGAMIAVPVTTSLAIFLQDYTKAMQNKK